MRTPHLGMLTLVLLSGCYDEDQMKIERDRIETLERTRDMLMESNQDYQAHIRAVEAENTRLREQTSCR